MKSAIYSFIICLLALQSVLLADHFDDGRVNYSFEHISIEQGLSQVSVLSIVQDHRGFIWFGTMDGLNRYDGYNFKTYRQHAFNQSTLSNNRINALTETSDSILWVGTDYGLNRYNRNTDSFKRFTHIPGDTNSIDANYIFALVADQGGNLWIGSDSGLCILRRNGHHFHPLHKNSDQPIRKSIHHLYRDNKQNIWAISQTAVYRLDSTGHHLQTLSIPQGVTFSALIELNGNKLIAGSNQGLFRLFPQTGGIQRFNANRLLKEIAANQITTIFRDSRNTIWISTTQGIWVCDQELSSGTFLTNQTVNRSSPSANFVRCILQDNSGSIWFGTDGSGIDKFVYARSLFNKIQAQNKTSGLSHSFVYAIKEELNGILWVGTNRGLDRFVPGQVKINKYRNNPADPLSLSHNRVRAIAVDKQANVWVGTYKGLNRYNRRKDRFEPFPLQVNGRNLGNEYKIITLLVDSRGNLWAGAEGLGLIRYQLSSRQTELFSTRVAQPGGLNNDNPYCLLESKDGRIWIGTYGGGVNVLDPPTGHFEYYTHKKDDRNTLSSNFIYSLHQTQDEAIWIGTYGGGMDRLDPATGAIDHFDIQDGLPNNLIYGIESDSKGNLWLSTNKGLAKFSPPYVNGRKTYLAPLVRVYNQLDGLPNDEFNFGAHYQSPSGTLYFGTVSGLCYFQPDSLHDNLILPKVVITDFKLFNAHVSIGKNSPLKKQICETESIELNYDQNNISFEFSALHYKNPAQNNYVYKLEGLDRDWIPTRSDRRFASYTNLPGGNYTFKVKASNSDGFWSDQAAAINIEIIPPFWLTWWFRITVILSVIALFVLFHRIRTISIKNRNAVLNQMNSLLRNEIRNREDSDKVRDILYHIAQANTSALNQREFYLLIQGELNRLLDATNLFIGLYDKKNHALELPFMQDEKGDFIEQVPIANTASALLIENKRPMLLTAADIEDLQKAGQIKVLGAKPVSWLGVPLILNEEAFGVLVVQSYSRDHIYTRKDLQLLEFVSNQLAVSIQKKQSEEEIRLLTQSINQSPTSIIITDRDGHFEYANQSYLKSNRITMDEIHTQSIDQVLRYEEAPEQKRIREAILQEGEWSGELKTKAPDGQNLWELVSISAVRNQYDEISNYVIFRENITPIKELQLQLNQAQKMDSIGTLAGGIAHDFNNMLTVINGHAEIGLLKAQNNKPVAKDMESILKAGKRAEALTRELLAFSRKQVYNAKVIDINHTLRDFEHMLQRLIGEDIQLGLLLPESPLFVKADKGQLEQVVMNLVVNARDAIQDPSNPNRKKSITIETRSRHVDSTLKFSNQTVTTGDYAQLTISDSGIGMSEETIEKVFEPFFTTKDVGKGTGLGMATVYGIVQQNHGFIHVYSEVNQGTTIKIFWPVAAADEANQDNASNPQRVREGFETILLVEDEEAVREFASEALRSFGYTVLEANDGLAALDQLKIHHSEIQLVITDIVMPEMSGTELVAFIENRYTDIKALLVSGYSNNHIGQDGQLDSSYNFIQKPYSVETLLTRVSNILGY